MQIWEKAVELQEQQDGGMKSMDKRSSSARPDLIDIDLVRGNESYGQSHLKILLRD